MQIIIEKITLELGDYTIFAGENNSGKTNLISAIQEHVSLEEYEKIYIAAEETNPQEKQIKNSAKGDPFYKIVESLIKPFFQLEMFQPLATNFNTSPKKDAFVQEVNSILGNLGVEKKRFDIKLSGEDLKMEVIIKLVKGIVHDLYDTDIDEVDIENIGAGTKRMIVVALIQAYANIKNDEKKTMIIFEEPEIYLHPKWKKSLHNSLLELSERENIIVLITTHDPYFIELGKNHIIYQVYRNQAKKDSTDIKPMDKPGFLDYKSDSEINYMIFDIPSKTYFIELYEYLLCNYLGEEKFEKLNLWIKEQVKNKKIAVEFEGDSNPLVSKLRHQLAHYKKEIAELEDIDEGYLRKRIEELKNLIVVI